MKHYKQEDEHGWKVCRENGEVAAQMGCPHLAGGLVALLNAEPIVISHREGIIEQVQVPADLHRYLDILEVDWTCRDLYDEQQVEVTDESGRVGYAYVQCSEMVSAHESLVQQAVQVSGILDYVEAEV